MKTKLEMELEITQEIVDAIVEKMIASGDYVPVVRCKDCKHRDPEDKKCNCGHDILWRLSRDDDWFCADGERREDDARYIDADELKRKALGLGEDVVCDDCTCEFINLIDDAPTIETEPVKRGRWIKHDDVHNVYGGTYIECSNCHEAYVVQTVADEKYCRNCGARMEDET